MEAKPECNMKAEAQNAVEVCENLDALRFLIVMFKDTSRKVIDCELSDLEKCYSKAKSVYVTFNLLYDDIQHKVEISNVLSRVKELDDLLAVKAILDTINIAMDMTYDMRRKAGK